MSSELFRKAPVLFRKIDAAPTATDFISRCESLAEKTFAESSTTPPAIIMAGAIGDPEFIPWLIDQMKILPLARPAGEAFTLITGVDLAYRDLERNRRKISIRADGGTQGRKRGDGSR